MIEFTITEKRLGDYSLNKIYAGINHWKRTEHKNYWHLLVVSELNRQKIPRKIFDKPVSISFGFNTKMDLDNHCYIAKLAIDSLKNYLIADDTRAYIQEIFYYWHEEGKDIKVKIEEMES
jgi:Holliday junction resolvase RusA-like endonuclease